ncbi:hypothetical protein B5F35_14785 [Anaeromassilibacillus sp. An200]|nr:hypothetical protein B5F35_14785 [Anaeromassilibacillus sp. An200]
MSLKKRFSFCFHYRSILLILQAESPDPGKKGKIVKDLTKSEKEAQNIPFLFCKNHMEFVPNFCYNTE